MDEGPFVKQTENRGIARLIAALGHSRTGLIDAWRRDEAFRLEAILFLVSFPAAAQLASSVVQAAILIGSVLVLMIVEVVNSAIETTIDRIGPERHELSRVAKDLGSAAVFLAALIPICTWSLVIAGKLGLIAL